MTAGVASLAARDLLLGIRRNGKVVAALPHSVYLEFTDVVPEPRVPSGPARSRLPGCSGHPGGRSRLGAGGRLPRGAAFVRILTP